MKFNEKWKYLLHGRDTEMEQRKQDQDSLKKQLERLKIQYDRLPSASFRNHQTPAICEFES